jgi:hypothetical protein
MSLRIDKWLAVLLLEFFVNGIVDEILAVHSERFLMWELASGAIFWVTMICWYHTDSTDREFRRSLPMTAAMLFLPGLAVPVYLYRSRARGRRARALLRLLGFCALAIVASAFGMALGALFAPT